MKTNRFSMGLMILSVAALVLSACAPGRMDAVRRRLGLAPAAAPAAIDPERKAGLEELYRKGAQALVDGDLDGARIHWRRYVGQAPSDWPQARDLRGYLTLIERETARRLAKEAAAREASAATIPMHRHHVAVMPFAYRREGAGTGSMASFNRAMVAMIMTDLAMVPSLRILERARIDALMAELQLGQDGLVDPASAARTARLLRAGTVVTGAVATIAGDVDYESGRYQITTAAADVAANRVIGSQQAQGPLIIWYKLQKEIVYELLETLGVTEIPPAVGRIHTKNWDAYAAFANGLEKMATGDFEGARKWFYAALRHDPDFALAEAAYLEAPARNLSLSQLQSEFRAAR